LTRSPFCGTFLALSSFRDILKLFLLSLLPKTANRRVPSPRRRTRRLTHDAMTDNPQPVQLTLDLPTLDSPAEQMFPKLTSAQIARVAARGQIRPVERGEVLFEPGDQRARFFVITAGTVEIVRQSSSGETLIRVLDRGPIHGRGLLALRPSPDDAGTRQGVWWLINSGGSSPRNLQATNSSTALAPVCRTRVPSDPWLT